MNRPYSITYCAAPALYRYARHGALKCGRARFGWCTGKKPDALFFSHDWNK